jgi:hypothetical protein
MEDIRKRLFWHPVHGELAKISADECTYENKDTIIHDTQIYVDEPMETVYERDRRLWVEQMVVTDLAGQNDIVNSEDFKCMIKYYFDTYDLIQNELSNFQTNK